MGMPGIQALPGAGRRFAAGRGSGCGSGAGSIRRGDSLPAHAAEGARAAVLRHFQQLPDGQGGSAPPLPLRPRPTLCGLGCVCGGSAPQPHCWDPGGQGGYALIAFPLGNCRWDRLPYPPGPDSPALRPWWGGAGMTPLLLPSITQHTGRWGGSEGAGFREQTLGMGSRTRRIAPTLHPQLLQPPTGAGAPRLAYRVVSQSGFLFLFFPTFFPPPAAAYIWEKSGL